MDRKAMYKLSYGLFVLTAREDEKDNGCIINTAIQAASEPNQLSICVNKANYTHDMIQRTGKFTVSGHKWYLLYYRRYKCIHFCNS